MRTLAMLAILLLGGSLTFAPLQAQTPASDGDMPATEPGEGPDDIDRPPRQQRDAPPPDPEESAEAARPQQPEQTPEEQRLVAERELESDVAHALLESLSEEELDRAARLLARANEIYNEHQPQIREARLAGDEAEYRALKERVEAETEAAAEELGTELGTYDRILGLLPAEPEVRQEFLAKVREARS